MALRGISSSSLDRRWSAAPQERCPPQSGWRSTSGCAFAAVDPLRVRSGTGGLGDRLERAQGAATTPPDFRLTALRGALHELTSPEYGRVMRAQLLLSDRDLTLLDERDSQSAYGASRRADSHEGAEQ